LAKDIRFTIQPIDSPQALESGWRELEARSSRSFFLSWAWIGTWLATLPAEFRPLLVSAREGARVAGLAVVIASTVRQNFRATRHGLHLNSTGDPRWDCIAIEHNGFLCDPREEGVILDGFFDWFAREAVGMADELRLPGITLPLDTETLNRRGFLHSTNTEPGYAVNLDFVAKDGELGSVLSGNARQKLRRTERDYESQGKIEIDAAGDVAEALGFFRALKSLHVASWERRGRRHSFSEPYFERFHEQLIAREFARGSVQLLRLRAGGRDFGYLYNFRKDGRVSAYQSGFDDSDRKRRPGVLSHSLAIRWNARNGERVYDFLAGENQMKSTFATDRYVLSWQVVRRALLKYRLESLTRHVVQRVFG
jgi:CelD/BcsL family acetyltransferase involved in cellulose biosynthesis